MILALHGRAGCPSWWHQACCLIPPRGVRLIDTAGWSTPYLFRCCSGSTIDELAALRDVAWVRGVQCVCCATGTQLGFTHCTHHKHKQQDAFPRCAALHCTQVDSTHPVDRIQDKGCCRAAQRAAVRNTPCLARPQVDGAGHAQLWRGWRPHGLPAAAAKVLDTHSLLHGAQQTACRPRPARVTAAPLRGHARASGSHRCQRAAVPECDGAWP